MSLERKISELRRLLGDAPVALAPTGDELAALATFAAEAADFAGDPPRTGRRLPFAAAGALDVRACIVALAAADGPRRAALASALRDRGFEVA
jgi:hypothetical protein